jgi:hypothetical protein
LEPGDPFRYDNLQGKWVYGHLIFKNASRVRAMMYDQPRTVTIPDKTDKKTGKVIVPGRAFETSGDEEQNLPLGMMVENLADGHQSKNRPTGADSKKAKEANTMDDSVKAAGLIAKYNHQHKQLQKALEIGDTGKAEVAQTRIDALEGEAKAAGVELPVWDEAAPIAPKAVEGDKADEAGATKAKEKAAKAKAAGALDKKAAKVVKEKAPKKLRKTHDCLCGCGTETLSLYAPGHDARVKGIILKVERGDLEKSAIPETVAPFVKFSGKWKTEGFKLTAAPVKVPGRDDVENTSLKAMEAMDV